jgi:hypothetical protein
MSIEDWFMFAFTLLFGTAVGLFLGKVAIVTFIR